MSLGIRLVWLNCGHLLWVDCIGIPLLRYINQYRKFLSHSSGFLKELRWISLEMSVLNLYRKKKFSTPSENGISFFLDSYIRKLLIHVLHDLYLSLEKILYISASAELTRIPQLVSVYVWIIWILMLQKIFHFVRGLKIQALLLHNSVKLLYYIFLCWQGFEGEVMAFITPADTTRKKSSIVRLWAGKLTWMF